MQVLRQLWELGKLQMRRLIKHWNACPLFCDINYLANKWNKGHTRMKGFTVYSASAELLVQPETKMVLEMLRVLQTDKITTRSQALRNTKVFTLLKSVQSKCIKLIAGIVLSKEHLLSKRNRQRYHFHSVTRCTDYWSMTIMALYNATRQTSSNITRGSSRIALILRRKVTASLPSISRWSYVRATYIIGWIFTCSNIVKDKMSASTSFCKYSQHIENLMHSTVLTAFFRLPWLPNCPLNGITDWLLCQQPINSVDALRVHKLNLHWSSLEVRDSMTPSKTTIHQHVNI